MYNVGSPPCSDSEVGEEDPVNHEELLSAISSLGRKRRVPQRSEAAVSVSEHHLGPTLSGGVSVGELLRELTTPAHLPLRKRLSTVEEKQKPLATPPSRVKADQIQRGVAYEESCKLAGKWAPIVKKNREAEHLAFPLQEDRVALPSLSTKVDGFTPQTEFEREIAQVLAGSDNVAADSDELTTAEREALMRVSLEEAAERRKELQKMRALMSYYEQKARRTKKIKSKKFHRIQRKKREAKQAGSEGGADTVERAERLRAQERMTLKHSRMSKWAKQQLARTHRDTGTQEALADLHSKRQTLKHKSAPDSSSEEEACSVQSEPEAPPTSVSGSNPWLRHSGVSERRAISSNSGHDVTQPPSHVTDTSSHVISAHSSILEPRPPDQLEAVRQAFAGDDVVSEFVEEKEQLLQESRAKTVDLTMPGWGTWGGEGVRPPKKARKVVKKIPERPRRDASIKNVIISENTDKKVIKHLVSDVPWPYTSKQQFDKTQSNPIGRHWNTEATFQAAIKPRVTTATGCVIEPIKLTDDVQDFMKRTEKKKKSVLKKRKRRVSESL